MRRPPLSLLLLALIGVLLSGWMVLDGLYVRMFGRFLHRQPLLNLWLRIQSSINSVSNLEVPQMEPQDLAWYFLVKGIFWIGALNALWLNQRWGYRLATAICLFSMLTLYMGTVIVFAALICLHTSPIRSLLEAIEEPNAA